MFPSSKSVTLDLLDKMLKFNPNERWSTKQCMEHSWFKDLLAQDELFGDDHYDSVRFDWSVDDFEPTKHILQTKI